MKNELDPEVLEYIQSLPPELRKIMLMKFLSGKSQLTNQDGKKGVFTPGENASYIQPHVEPAAQAFENVYRKRAKTVPR